MAIVDFGELYPRLYPCLAIISRGSLSGWWIHKQYKTRKVVAKYYYPYNPKTPFQQAWRKQLYDANYNWKHFPDETKRYYNSRTTPVAYDGNRRYLSLYLHAHYPPVVPADIEFDSLTTSYNNSAHETHSFSHTCAGDNRLLVVIVADQTGATHSSVKYNGVSMTKAKEAADGGRVSIWYLVNPASGANTVLVTLGGFTGGGTYGAISYTGVKQSSPLDKTGSASGVATSGSCVLNLAEDGEVIVTGIGIDTSLSGGFTAGAGLYERYDINQDEDSAGADWLLANSGNRTVGWSWSGNESFGLVAASFKKA